MSKEVASSLTRYLYKKNAAQRQSATQQNKHKLTKSNKAVRTRNP